MRAREREKGPRRREMMALSSSCSSTALPSLDDVDSVVDGFLVLGLE